MESFWFASALALLAISTCVGSAFCVHRSLRRQKHLIAELHRMLVMYSSLRVSAARTALPASRLSRVPWDKILARETGRREIEEWPELLEVRRSLRTENHVG